MVGSSRKRSAEHRRKISTRQRLLSNFNSSADEMRGARDENARTDTHKGGYEAVTNVK